MKKNVKIIIFILIASLITSACTVMVKPTPVVKVKLQDDNGHDKKKHK